MYCCSPVNNLSIALLRLFQWIASFGSPFPWILMYLYFAALRLLFVVTVGLGTWLQNFSDFGFGFWFVLGLLSLYLMNLNSKQLCFYPEDRCKSDIERQNQNEMPEKGTRTLNQKGESKPASVFGALTRVYETLRRRNPAGERADLSQHGGELPAGFQGSHRGPETGLIEDLNVTKDQVDFQIADKIKENESLKADFAKNLEEINNTVDDVKLIAKNGTDAFEKLVQVENIALKDYDNNKQEFYDNVEKRKEKYGKKGSGYSGAEPRKGESRKKISELQRSAQDLKKKDHRKSREDKSASEDESQRSAQDLKKEDHRKSRDDKSRSKDESQRSARDLKKEDHRKSRDDKSRSEDESQRSAQDLKKEDRRKSRDDKSRSEDKPQRSAQDLKKEDRRKSRDDKSRSEDELQRSARDLKKEDRRKSRDDKNRSEDDLRETGSEHTDVDQNQSELVLAKKKRHKKPERIAALGKKESRTKLDEDAKKSKKDRVDDEKSLEDFEKLKSSLDEIRDHQRKSFEKLKSYYDEKDKTDNSKPSPKSHVDGGAEIEREDFSHSGEHKRRLSTVAENASGGYLPGTSPGQTTPSFMALPSQYDEKSGQPNAAADDARRMYFPKNDSDYQARVQQRMKMLEPEFDSKPLPSFPDKIFGTSKDSDSDDARDRRSDVAPFSHKVDSLENLEKENMFFRKTMEEINKIHQDLVNRHTQALKEIRELSHLRSNLPSETSPNEYRLSKPYPIGHSTPVSEYTMENRESRRFAKSRLSETAGADPSQIKYKLQNSISSARVKLLNVEKVLNGLHNPIGSDHKSKRSSSFCQGLYQPKNKHVCLSGKYPLPETTRGSKLSQYCPEMLAELNRVKRNRIYNRCCSEVLDPIERCRKTPRYCEVLPQMHYPYS